MGKHSPALYCAVIPSLQDTEVRVRQGALEALYNIIKVSRACALPFLPDIFDGLHKVPPLAPLLR